MPLSSTSIQYDMSSIGVIVLLFLSLVQCDCGNKEASKGGKPSTINTPTPPPGGDTQSNHSRQPSPTNSAVTPDMLATTEHLPALHQTLQKLANHETIDWNTPPENEQVLEEAIAYQFLEPGQDYSYEDMILFTDIITLLLDQGTPVTGKHLFAILDKFRQTQWKGLISRAAGKLIEKAPEAAIQAKNQSDQTILMVLIKEQISNTVFHAEKLIEKGVDIHAKDIHQQTAFNIAILEDDLGTIELLLKHGAKIDQQTLQQYFLNPSLLVGFIFDPTATLLIEYAPSELIDQKIEGRDDTLLEHFIDKQNPQIIRLLLEKATVTPKAFLLATAHPDEMLKLLLEKQPNINIQDEKGYTALMYAADQLTSTKIDKTKETVKDLINKGADKSLQNNNHQRAYDIAATKAISGTAFQDVLNLLRP